MRKFSLLVALLASTFAATAVERSSFNDDWKFKLGDLKGNEAVAFNDASWRELSVPHDWSIEGEYAEDNPMTFNCGYLPAGRGWYRKTIDVPKSWIGKYVEVAFDGVFMNSTVWINGEKMGTRPYGWSSFAYEVPESAKKSGKITVAVRVDNELQPAARWYTGSGIYGNTWIDVRENVHVPRSGIYVRTEGDEVIVETEVANVSASDASVTVLSEIKDCKGRVVASNSGNVSVKSEQTVTNNQRLFITNPSKWSPESPYLYTLVTSIKKGDKTIDVNETAFGVRDLKWEAKTGMWLNGKNIKLQGVCNHADAGALGVAIPEKILKFRIQQMLDMGCNAIRTTHYPRTPEFYRLCDEMGMMVMDEVFDGWHKKVENEYAVRFFEEWWERDLTDWLKRDRNHPSIVIWSVGNETHGEVGKDILEVCRKYDTTRPVTSGHAEAEIMDVFGVNGASENKNYVEDLDIDKPFIGTENTHTFHIRGYYRTKTWYRDGLTGKGRNANFYPDMTEKEVFTNDWITSDKRVNPRNIYFSSYDNATIRMNVRHNIQKLRDIPHFSGSFRWTGYDYIGEAKYHGGWPFIGLSSGAVDLANFPKDLYYLYQSQWTSKPMVHILPHWTHPNIEEGTEIPVWVYSNCDEVELFFDGKSMGKQTPGETWDKMNCQWMIGWKPGKISVVGYKEGKVAARENIATASAPSQIKLSVDGEPMAATKGDITQVRVTSADAKGEFYPYGENRSYFHVLGSGKVRALDNGSLNDHDKYFEAESRLAFYGLTRGYIEATDAKGDINLVVASILGEKRQITSDVVTIDCKVLNLRGKKANPAIEIYYTTDGSQPTKASNRYKAPFKVELGTTVKALVFVDGKELWTMEELFAEDAGFEFYAGEADLGVLGDQAEDAKMTNCSNLSVGAGFVGGGFVIMNKEQSSSLEWYYENDGDAGKVTVKVRYSVLGEDCKATLNVNGKDYKLNMVAGQDELYQKYWATTSVPAEIQRGGNTLIVTVPAHQGVSIDEIVVE